MLIKNYQKAPRAAWSTILQIRPSFQKESPATGENTRCPADLAGQGRERSTQIIPPIPKSVKTRTTNFTLHRVTTHTIAFKHDAPTQSPFSILICAFKHTMVYLCYGTHSISQTKGENEMHTKQQQKVLDDNKCFVVASVLEDRDLLILDTTPVYEHIDGVTSKPFGPYILLKNGWVQGVNYHYRFYHQVDVPADTHAYADPSTDGFRPKPRR